MDGVDIPREEQEAQERVVVITPLMNRLLLFWSDRRCPHEVRERVPSSSFVTHFAGVADCQASLCNDNLVLQRAGCQPAATFIIITINTTITSSPPPTCRQAFVRVLPWTEFQALNCLPPPGAAVVTLPRYHHHHHRK